jgi:hypothetical protein
MINTKDSGSPAHPSQTFSVNQQPSETTPLKATPKLVMIKKNKIRLNTGGQALTASPTKAESYISPIMSKPLITLTSQKKKANDSAMKKLLLTSGKNTGEYH